MTEPAATWTGARLWAAYRNGEARRELGFTQAPLPPPESPGLTVTQLATQVPKRLHRAVKVWCVHHDESIAEFTTEALRNELWLRQLELAGA